MNVNNLSLHMAVNMRRELMDFFLLNFNMIVPDVFLYTLCQLALDQADEILNQLGEPRGSICIVKDYAVRMRYHSCLYGDQF
jgi:hypothetical protein